MLRQHDRVDKYEIRERIASGGMGALYLAYDAALERTVALKLFHGDLNRATAREDFRREARAIAALNHPNIVTIYDSGEYESQPYLVMEYIRGETLADLIRRAEPDVTLLDRVMWIEGLCAAVSVAHARGIIHRDIKPANLMIDTYGRLRVLDFGIARMRGSIASHNTARIATAGYVAPEQIRGGEVDARSDVFSIGVVCYELLTYAPAFGGDTEHASTHRTLHDDPTPVELLNPAIDGEIATIVRQAMRRDAAERFQSAALLGEALTGVRRRLESGSSDTLSGRYVPRVHDPGMTVAPPAESEPRETSRRDTGGARKTGPPRRSTREMLERQVQEWMALARSHLTAQDLSGARDACNEALRLLPDHEDARRLSREIDQLGDEPTVVVDAPTLAVPPSSGQAPANAPGSASDETIVVRPTARQASPPPFMPSGTAIQRQAAGTVEHSSPKGSASQGLSESTTVPTVPPGGEARPDPFPAGKRPVPATDRTRWRYPALAAMVVAAAGVAWYWARPAPVIPTVAVVIDASPWATVRAIVNQRGEAIPLPDEPSTPLRVALIPGTYRLTLVGPPPASVSRERTLVIEAAKPPAPVIERFDSVTAKEYFEHHVERWRPEAGTPTPDTEP